MDRDRVMVNEGENLHNLAAAQPLTTWENRYRYYLFHQQQLPSSKSLLSVPPTPNPTPPGPSLCTWQPAQRKCSQVDLLGLRGRPSRGASS